MKTERDTQVCENCGGDVIRAFRQGPDGREPLARCLSCGREYSSRNGEYYRYYAMDYLRSMDPSILTFGMEGNRGRDRFSLAGHQVFQEEANPLPAPLHIWSIAGEGPGMMELEGAVYRLQAVRDPRFQGNDGGLLRKGKPVKCRATACRLLLAEGDVSGDMNRGDRAVFCRFSRMGRHFMAMISDGGTVLWRLRPMGPRRLSAVFPGSRTGMTYGLFRRYRLARAVTALVLLSWSILLGAGVFFGTGSVTVQGIMGEKRAVSPPDGIIGGTRYLYGPFAVEEGSGLYRMAVVTPVQGRQSLYLVPRDLLLERTGGLEKRNLDLFLPYINLLGEPVESFRVGADNPAPGRVLPSFKTGGREIFPLDAFRLEGNGQYFIYLDMEETVTGEDVPIVTMARISNGMFLAGAAALCLVMSLVTGLSILFMRISKFHGGRVSFVRAVAVPSVICLLVALAAVMLTRRDAGFPVAGERYRAKERPLRQSIRPGLN